MKLTTILSATAVTGLGLALISPLFGLSVAGLALLLLGVVRDYTPRRPLWTPRTARVLATARLDGATETMKLAA